MKFADSQTTLTTLANASELVASVVQEVVGNDLADTINGTPLTRTVIYNLAQSKIQSVLADKMGRS